MRLCLIKKQTMGAPTFLHCFNISREKLVKGGYNKDCFFTAKGEKCISLMLKEKYTS